jgi:hypothetical protein
MGVRLCSCCNPGVTSIGNISGAIVGDKVEDFPWAERQRLTDFEGASDIRIIKISTVHLATPLWQLRCFHITVSAVATVSTPER